MLKSDALVVFVDPGSRSQSRQELGLTSSPRRGRNAPSY